MGTNYYLTNTFDQIEGKEPLHIGKSSYGWAFALHVEEDGSFPSSLIEWQALWNKAGAVITDEYGNELTVKELEQVIFVRPVPAGRNLRRFPPDSTYWHGSETFDYCVGEFS